LHKLRKIWWESLSIKEKETISSTPVYGTGRSTSVPPLQAPYDFGIDKTWWALFKHKYPEHVKDWFTYGNPEGFHDEEMGEDGVNEDGEGGYGSAAE
jgi:hypothetical protein